MMDLVDERFDEEGMDIDRRMRPALPKARPFVPPAIDPALLPLIDRLSRRHMPVPVRLGDRTVTFTPRGLGPIDSAVSPADRVLFWFRIDGRPLVLQMAKGLYERLLARIDPELLAAEIDRDILPLLLEAFLEDSLCAAETRLQGRIELAAVEPGGALNLKGLDIALDIAIDGDDARRAALRVGPDDAERLAALFAARPKPARPFGDLMIDLRFRAGSVGLDLGSLKALKPGDVLLVDGDPVRLDDLALVAGEHWLFPIEATPAGPVVKAVFRRADPQDQEDWMMDDDSQTRHDDGAQSDVAKDGPKADTEPTEPADGTDASTPDATFDDLPVKLVFELGRLELPLGRLQEIGPGHVFPLERPLGEAVEIHAGKRRIGRGEIVRIDERIGVRVLRLFGQNEA